MEADTLAQREATQLRLNAELDAGALAVISDMESFLQGAGTSLAHSSNKKKAVTGGTNGGNKGSTNVSANRRSSNGVVSQDGLRDNGRNIRDGTAANARRAALRGNTTSGGNTTDRASPIRATADADTHVAMAERARGRGTPGSASSGPAVRSARAVARSLGGGMWDNANAASSNDDQRQGGGSGRSIKNSVNSNTTSGSSISSVGEVGEADGQPQRRMEQQARRGVQRGLAEAAAAPPVRGNGAVTPSTLFRLSESIKGATRASGGRAMLMKAVEGSGLSPRPGDYYEHDDDCSSIGVGQGLASAGGGRGGQRQHLEGSSGDAGNVNERAGHAHDTPHGNPSTTAGGEGVPAGIGEEATARFLKAKLKSCQAQLEEVQQAHNDSHQEAVELRKQAAADQEQLRRLSRRLQQLQETKAKESKAKNEESLNAASLPARVSELERELGSLRRTARQSETDKKSLEVRLHRALEEISKQKEAVRQTRGQHKDAGQGQRLEMSRLEAQCQRLERQKLELLSAFKKQLKLIDVLKRQKFHVEAARLLGFTEEDFVKTLDWESR